MMGAGKLPPETEIAGLGGLTIGDFWSWAYSDTLSNRNRAIFAEFLVGAALGVLDRPRIEWDATDLTYQGYTVEVKSAAYVQSWPQSRLSTIRFDVAEKIADIAALDELANPLTVRLPHRRADCYVFCLYTERDRAAANVLNIPAWHFYVVPTVEMNQAFGSQKGAAFSRIAELCPEPVIYDQLKARVDAALAKDFISNAQ